MTFALNTKLVYFPKLLSLSLDNLAEIHTTARKLYKHSYQQLTANRVTILFKLPSLQDAQGLLKEVFGATSVVPTAHFLVSVALFCGRDTPEETASFISHLVPSLNSGIFSAMDSFKWLWQFAVSGVGDFNTIESFCVACRDVAKGFHSDSPKVEESKWRSIITENPFEAKSKNRRLLRQKSLAPQTKKRTRPVGTFSGFSPKELQLLQSIWFKSGATADGCIDMRTVMIILRNESSKGDIKDQDFLDRVIANLMAVHSGGLVKVIEGDRSFVDFVNFLVPGWKPDLNKEAGAVFTKTEVGADSIAELKELYSFFKKSGDIDSALKVPSHRTYDLSSFDAFLADFLPIGFVASKEGSKAAVIKEKLSGPSQELQDPLVIEMENRFNQSQGGQVILDSRKLNSRQMRFSEKRAVND